MAAEALETRILPATIVVTSLDDTVANDGEVTLREAIQAADNDVSVDGSTAGNGADRIEFSSDLFLAPGTTRVKLGGSELSIASEVTIDGRVNIDPDGQSRAFHFLSTSNVTLQRISIDDGAADRGGAIRNDGTATIRDSTIKFSDAALEGGAIANFGDLHLDTVELNFNSSDGIGGAISNHGTLRVDNSSFYRNRSATNGAGLYSDGSTTISNSTLSANTSNQGHGGGIYSNGNTTIINSTIVRNQAGDCTTAQPCTSSASLGGGIFANAPFTMHNTVIADNFAANLNGTNETKVANDIDTTQTTGIDAGSSHNFIARTSGFTGVTDGINGNQVGGSAMLGGTGLNSVTDNAHPWQFLLPGSPLIDAGNSALAVDTSGQPLEFDRNGLRRVVSGTVDIGAYELDPAVRVTAQFVDTIGGGVSFQEIYKYDVQITATPGDDFITLGLGNRRRVTVNGTNYPLRFSLHTEVKYVIDSLDGTDQVRVEAFGGSNESATVWPLNANIVSTPRRSNGPPVLGSLAFGGSGNGRVEPNYRVSVRNSEYITIDAHDGQDTVTFNDSPEDDLFVGKRTFAYMSGNGYTNVGRGFERITANSANGGTDSAQLSTDLAFNRYSATSNLVQFVTGSTQYRLNDFEQTDTYFLENGGDPDSHADFYDSVGNDVFESSPGHASMRGLGFDNEIRNVPIIRATSAAGGIDTAIFNDSAGDDSFVVSPDQAVMKPLLGSAFSNTAIGFSNYVAHGSTGNDDAEVHDSAGDDTLVATGDYVVIRGSGYYAQVNDFDVRDVYALNGGEDEAQAFDHSGTNHFIAQGISASIDDSNGTAPPTWRTNMIGFTSVLAIGNAGGLNTLSLGSVAFDFHQLGSWNLL